VLFERGAVPGVDPPARLLARPLRAGRGLVLVVGGTLDGRNAAVGEFDRLLVLGAPLTLVLVWIAGYGLAVSALRPVARMRRRAAQLARGVRIGPLPLPPARDEVRRLGETLNHLLGRVEEAVSRERAFLADASHELRTPLHILTAELDLATRRERSVEELRAAVCSAREETRLLTKIANDLLLITRADAGELQIDSQTVPVSELLDSLQQRFCARAAALGRELELHAPQRSLR
jgi:two-component system OmpR family sensor kinase